jgi:hypothetical protein
VNVRAMRLDAAIEWRERPHDDLVLAVAIAVWIGGAGGPAGVGDGDVSKLGLARKSRVAPPRST